MSTYQGLGQYSRPKEQAADMRSDEAKRRAAEVSAWGIAAQRLADDVSQADWQEFRRVQDSVVGVDRGLTSAQDRTAYQQHQAANRFGRVQANGHHTAPVVPGSTSVPRIWASDVQPDPAPRRVIVTGSTGEGWQ